MAFGSLPLLIPICVGLLGVFLYQTVLSPSQCEANAGFNVTKVMEQAVTLSTRNWEYGTVAEALLELHNPELTVFGADPFPGGKIPKVTAEEVAGLKYVKPYIRTLGETLIVSDGCAGDPASLGIPAILLGQSSHSYLSAADRQASYLLDKVPRFWNKAISHRDDVAEVWSDFPYMAPPFLAYQAVATNDANLLKEAVDQCTLHRQILQINTTSSSAPERGLWHHIISDGTTEDLGLWSTGNGWAAAGLTRVLATIQKWNPPQPSHPTSADLRAQHLSVLKASIKEILDGAIRSPHDPANNLLRNNLNDHSWFGETAGTALLASAAYRVAVLAPETFDQKYIDWADEMRQAVAACVDPETGIAAPADNALDWTDRKPMLTGSPEGQAFVVMLYAAYRDCVCGGVCKGGLSAGMEGMMGDIWEGLKRYGKGVWKRFKEPPGKEVWEKRLKQERERQREQ